jgi:hypothetical protein
MENKPPGLTDKFRHMIIERADGNLENAFRIFQTIKVTDFPVMPDFPMSHGILADAKTALFYIDHDWDDDEWCGRFLADVIRVLEVIQAVDFPEPRVSKGEWIAVEFG